MPQLLASLCFLHLSFSTKKTSMKILALAALIPMMAAPAMAGPYVESKTGFYLLMESTNPHRQNFVWAIKANSRTV
jgi:hypothetical protein